MEGITGSPPISYSNYSFSVGQIIRTQGGTVDVDIGDNVCINRTATPPPSINLDCAIEALNLENGIRSVVPDPQRIWTFVDDAVGSQTVEIYNETDGESITQANEEFYDTDFRAIFRPEALMGVDNFLLVQTGRLTMNVIVTSNLTNPNILPGQLPQRDAAFIQELVVDELLGTYTCLVENVYGSDTATTEIRECGEQNVVVVFCFLSEYQRFHDP